MWTGLQGCRVVFEERFSQTSAMVPYNLWVWFAPLRKGFDASLLHRQAHGGHWTYGGVSDVTTTLHFFIRRDSKLPGPFPGAARFDRTLRSVMGHGIKGSARKADCSVPPEGPAVIVLHQRDKCPVVS